MSRINTEEAIIDFLVREGAIRLDEHFVYTSEKHGPHYINLRQVAHHARWMDDLGHDLAEFNDGFGADLIVGPETLGRTLAQSTATWMMANKTADAIWCSFEGEGEEKTAVFSPKLDFGRLVPGRRVMIVDDLLTTGSSIRQVVRLVEEHDGQVVGVGVVVRRSTNVTAETCGVPELRVLAEAPPGFAAYDPDDCPLCADNIPIVLRPGHGHEWITSHPGYPVV